MSQALGQYISRVDKTPCMKTTINLYRGAKDHEYVKRKEKLLVFLEGNEMQKSELEKSHPMLYNHFCKVWKVRCNHMDRSLPSNYIFALKCCGMTNFPHPLCQGNFRCYFACNFVILFTVETAVMFLFGYVISVVFST